MELTQSILIAFAVATLVIPLALGLFGMLLLFTGRDSLRLSHRLGWLTVLVSGILLLLSLLMLLAREQFPIAFSIITVNLHIDALSLYFILLVNVVALVAAWNAIPYLGDEFPEPWLRRPTFFHASVNLFHFTMLLVPMVDNLIGLWIAIELTTLFSAFLVGHRGDKNAWEAAWKYLIITSTGIILALLGTMFLANAVVSVLPDGELASLLGIRPQDAMMNWTFLMELAEAGKFKDATDFIRLSFLFILIGYGTKAGLAPMHTWLPDGHGEAPSPISALLSGVLLKSALYAILRFYTLTNTVLGDTTFTSTVLLGAGVLSLLVATPFILKENPFKRVLAYHSLEHMGIITFGIGIGGPIALFGALLHTFNHAITKSLMFLSFGNVMRRYEQALDKKKLERGDITGVLRSMPLTGAILTLGGLALVGTPPFNIFMSEFIILWGAIDRFQALRPTSFEPDFPRWVIALAVAFFMLSTTFIFYGLVRHLARHVLNKMPEGRKLEENWLMDLLPLAFLMVFVLLLGVWIIPPLANLITDSVQIVLNVG